jgi:predicted SAM-dependent methyltransferase
MWHSIHKKYEMREIDQFLVEVIMMDLLPSLKYKTLGRDQDDNALRLHIGGRQRKEGWKILDIQPRLEVDFIGCVTDLSKFYSNSFKDIYASHVLEHIPQTKMVNTLLELRRILRDDGRLMISVPDMDVLCRLFLDKTLSLDERFHVMRIIFGGQVDANDFHYVGLNMDLMVDSLRTAGFSRIKRVESFGLFNDTSDFTVKGVPISLNVEVWK